MSIYNTQTPRDDKTLSLLDSFYKQYQSSVAVMRVFPTPPKEIFSEMVKVVFYGFKIIGLAPFSIVFKTLTRNSRNSSITVFLFSRMGLLYNLVLVILIQIIGILEIPSVISAKYPNKSSLNEVLDLTEHILYTSTSSIIIVYLAFRQKKAAIIMNRLLDVHFLLYGAREQSFNKRSYIFLSLQIAFHVFLWATSLSTEVLSNPYPGLAAGYLIRVIIYFFLIEYSIILGVVVRELEILNQNLSNLNDFPSYLFRTTLPPEHSAALNTSSTRSQLATLKLLHSIRTTLFDLSQNIADFFSIPILLCIACAFLSLIEASYIMILSISVLTSNYSMIVQVNGITWILISVCPLMLLAFNVTEVVTKASLTGRIVHTLLATSKDQEIITELEQFSLHLIHEDVRFTAYGFFTLDFTLLQSILGATVTYLVIVIQFKQSANSDN